MSLFTRLYAPLALVFGLAAAPALAQETDPFAGFRGVDLSIPILEPGTRYVAPAFDPDQYKEPRHCLKLENKFENRHLVIDRSDDGKRTTGLRLNRHKIGVNVHISLGPHRPKPKC